MGMYDHYEPVPQLTCPVCHVALVGWQGKGGPCAIFLWRQGVAWPVDQPINEECRLSEADRKKWRLPGEFEIYSYDCGRGQPVAEVLGRALSRETKGFAAEMAQTAVEFAKYAAEEAKGDS